MSKTISRAFGDSGEETACTWLVSHGYTILDRNVSNRFGEIDIIARKGRVVHFVEVKTRGKRRLGFGIEAVDTKKLHKIILCAQVIARERFPNMPFCIDAISIDEENLRFYENITL